MCTRIKFQYLLQMKNMSDETIAKIISSILIILGGTLTAYALDKPANIFLAILGGIITIAGLLFKKLSGD